MTEVYCEWFTCNWNDETRGKCLYDGRIYLSIAQEDNPVGDLLECDKYLWLKVKKRDN